MAIDPVIVDDGGSTRLKQVLPNGVGEMDKLLEVDPVGDFFEAVHEFKAQHSGFTSVQTVFLNQATGLPTMLVAVPIGLGDKVEIVSGKFVVTLEVAAQSTLKVAGTVANVEPVIDARQNKKGNKKQRRYVVSNAPPIDTVKVIQNGGGTTSIFPPAVNVISVYTMVYIN